MLASVIACRHLSRVMDTGAKDSSRNSAIAGAA
jgi:hypothetical protein